MANAILSVEQVSVIFDGFTVLDGLNFNVDYGELRFLIGPNGAGKTTLLDIITGKTRPAHGQVIFDGQYDVTGWPEHRRVRQGIGRKFQTPAIFGSLTVVENLETAIGFRDGILALARATAPAYRRAVAETLDLIGLASRAATRAGLLSHGEKQWLEIGMLLIK